MIPRKRVLRDDPFANFDEGSLEFRLTYQGLLLSESTRGDLQGARATHKQEIRKVFHRQLKRLWTTHYMLAMAGVGPPSGTGHYFAHLREAHTIEALATRFSRFGYRFVPLATRSLNLLCSVDVLFLRSDPPGSIISAGDIDNRLKTLFDALTVPRDLSQVGDYKVPSEDEDPFHCLLEDDSMITRAVVETDTMLDPVNDNGNTARVIISVKISPSRISADNIGFV